MTDFEKAIHSVALTFIQTTLSYFNFGAPLCNWITTIQFNALSCVQGRHLSNVLDLGVAVDKVILYHLIFFILCEN